MTPSTENPLEQQFAERLSSAIQEVRKHTRVGVCEILNSLSRQSALEVAKSYLQRRTEGPPLLQAIANRPSRYFYAARRIQRLDLSVEALAVEPHWNALFTAAEKEAAVGTLQDAEFVPSLSVLEGSEAPGTGLPAPAQTSALLALPSESWTQLQELLHGPASCSTAAQFGAVLRNGGSFTAHANIRKHIADCLNCRREHADLLEAYERMDQWAMQTWRNLLENFEQSLQLEDKDLMRLLLAPSPAEDPEEATEDDLASIHFFIRPICVWRALRLGVHLGRFMAKFANCFMPTKDIWFDWRNGTAAPAHVAETVQAIPDGLFLSALAAAQLPYFRYWPEEEDGLLWLPSDGDLHPVPQLLHVEDAEFDDWEEILGKPPEDFNPSNVLALAFQAALGLVNGQLGATESPNAAWLAERLGRMEATLNRTAENTDEILSRHDAIISTLERMVEHMPSTDRLACEEELMDNIGDVYRRLAPEVRCRLLAATQLRRMRALAEPSLLVVAVASAFESQARSAVFSPLFAHLESRSINTLSRYRAAHLTLGQMETLLRDKEPAIDEFCALARLRKDQILGAVGMLKDPRNDAAHGKSIAASVADEYIAAWLGYDNRKGGIFNPLFPPD
jgi:hypothetical protein